MNIDAINLINENLQASAEHAPVARTEWLDGDKFAGGFGATKLFEMDYWTLRARSSQLFEDNLYARGLIRRFITNEINTGISPECCPDEELTGVSEGDLATWTDKVETRFAIWGKNPMQCDWTQQDTFGAIQQAARLEALVAGDVLVVLRVNPQTNLPMIKLVPGDKVRTPIGGGAQLAKGHRIRHGVETDARGRTVAHWVQTDEDFKMERVPAWGKRTGRKVSWLVFGTEKRLEQVRGVPLLSLVLQSLKEIDRYRDSVQRKAVVNSLMAMFIKKTEDKQGSRVLTSAASRRGTVQTEDTDGTPRSFNITQQMPGFVPEELQQGEEPVLLGGQGTDTNFATFEQSIIAAVAWANEAPPEIVTLAFSSNYSASQAAINEFKIYLNKVWAQWGDRFCQPIYTEWLLSEVLRGRVKADGLLRAWRNPQEQDVYGAWIACDWYGSIKPSTDMLKQAKGSKLLVNEGWSNNAREARGLTGTKFAKNIKRIKRENELKVEAARPVAEFEAEFGKPLEEFSASAEQLEEMVAECVESTLDDTVSEYMAGSDNG